MTVSKIVRGRITKIADISDGRGPMYIRVTTGAGPGHMILLSYAYQKHGLKVGDFVEVEVQERVLFGMTALKIRKVDPPLSS